MKNRRWKNSLRKLFIYVCMVSIVLSNFLLTVSGKVSAEEGTVTVVPKAEAEEQTEPAGNEVQIETDPAEEAGETQPDNPETGNGTSSEPVAEETNEPVQTDPPAEEPQPAPETETEVKEEQPSTENEAAPAPKTQPVEKISEAEQASEASQNAAPDANQEAAPAEAEPAEDYESFPELLITEISPNSEGADDYEYFELYNNSTQPMNLANYAFVYTYTDGSYADKLFSVPATVIEPQGKLVFWTNKNGKTLADFNAHFGLSLTSGQVIEVKDPNAPGFANGGNRGLTITDHTGNEVVSANYLPGETGNDGTVVEYKYPVSGTEMARMQTLAAPVPGTLREGQVPASPVTLDAIPEDTEAPAINHEPVTESEPYTDIAIHADVTDNMAVPTATLFYKKESDTEFKSLAMSGTPDDLTRFYGVIPGNEADGNITYYIEAQAGGLTESTEPAVISVEIPEETYSESEMLITEISPDSQGSDHYEYFEIYNNSTQPMNPANYSFIYHYVSGTYEDLTLQVPAVSIAPQETMVFWFNSQNLSLSDFNTKFGVNLTGSHVQEFSGTGFTGLANGGDRGLIIKDHDGNEVISATYLGGESNNTGAVIQYLYPAAGTAMEKFAVLASPTPGTFDPAQVPVNPVVPDKKPEDTEAPVIAHSAVVSSEAFAPISIEATVTDNMAVPSAQLFYKNEADTEFTSIEMMMDTENADSFSAEIPASAVGGNITYYIQASDGSLTSQTEEVTIEVNVPEETYSDLPLLITELSPNTAGGGTDYYEFFELYNNTTQPISTINYSFVYKYTDSGSEKIFQVPEVTIEPQESMVFWYNNGANTIEDFNAQFASALTAEELIPFNDGIFPGFSNGGNRALIIRDNEGTEMVYADYLGSDNDNDGGDIQYKFPASGTVMDKFEVLAAPTPGAVSGAQVPVTPIDTDLITDEEAPEIEHTPVTMADAFAPLAIEATITDNMAVPAATLFYKNEESEDFKSLAMTAGTEDLNRYSAEIPGAEVSSNLMYYIEATDGNSTIETEQHEVAVDKKAVDYSKVPRFLVTEIVPDSTNEGTADGYEFIEVYNNTDKDMNFKDYKLQYRYGADTASDVVWASVPDDFVLPSQETVVFWIINSQNGDKTVADFNTNYGSSLVENEDIVRIYSDGMANGSMRGLVVATNAKEEITVSYYNDQTGTDDTLPDKGILYKYPEDGSTESVKVSAGVEDATPGTVESFQVPGTPVHIEADTVDPVIENKTSVSEVQQTDDILIEAAALDNAEVKSVRLFFRTNGETEFQEVLLPLNPETHLYDNTIYAADLIGKSSLEYYFMVSDGFNEVTSNNYTIDIENNLDDADLRLNLENQEIVSGIKVLKGTSKEDFAKDVQLFIDDIKVQSSSYNALENEAYLALEVNGLNTYFQNAVTMGEDILYLMDKDWLTHWKTFTIPVEADRLQIGENVITVRAGNKASPFQLEEDEENRDDYNLRNVRLILADGTVIRDAAKNDPSQVFDMGDDGTYRPFEDFTFTLTDEHARSKAFAWDTTTVADGSHTVKAADNDEEVQTIVQVDNTAPEITSNIEDNKSYKGAFTIDADAVDAIAGVESLQAMLDGEEVAVPYETSSSQLAAGEHVFKVTAVDNAGNKSEKVDHFSVNNENPDKPELISPSDGASTPVDGDPHLKVKVTDPTGDDMDVTFYEGYQYTAENAGSVKAFKNVTDTEPPNRMVPDGEEAFSNDDISLVSELDGSYLTTDSSTGFPYHRFDVTLDPSIDESDKMELVWKGQSLQGRKVSMYAWNHAKSKWILQTYKIAGTEDFELKADITVGDYAKDSKINVLVQDEIPSSPEEYDYTFVWMSDTQYYSESYPYIYDQQTKWIAQMRDEMKIKYVFHTGDVVDEADKVEQWQYADEYMRTLEDSNIPYGVLAGNHDVNQLTNDYTEFTKWFGADRFEDEDHYGGTYKNNRGHYDLISSEGNDFIMLYMGWGVQDEDLEWMDQVLKEHPNRKAILNFHEYLLVSGNRSPLGNRIYNKVVEPNENVVAVLSGHYHDSETLIDEIDDDGDGTADREVYQMLGDYQGGPEGGQGYLKLMHFDQDNNRVMINTYSPYLDDYNFYEPGEFPGKDELTMPMDLTVEEKRVATDYFSVNVYTDEVIGEQEAVENGGTAELVWEGLDENESYSWYVTAEDRFTGQVVSDIWTFTKGVDEENPPVEPGDPSDDGGEDDPSSPRDPSDGGGEDDPGSPSDGDENGGGQDPADHANDNQQEDNEDSGGNGDGNGGTDQDSSGADDEGSEKDDSNSGQDKKESNHGIGSLLPDTGTAYYLYLTVGILITTAAAAGMIFIRRRKNQLQHQ
ncbi:LPXTG cell wall anchor domain-containing protein [Bacillus salacetis]|uniref:LPXTG cell wall anchor domain-containing protein n=1 Tax=Bacillus salacetis TaxID=2315464 RepID=A0A3A1R1Z4_9BACI|nr:lamin tail domain-containing protein [Bacillus salacetis]RIW36077.1 LPXTG cell wall anchor domain-containing protein [Bacillus salacetis]